MEGKYYPIGDGHGIVGYGYDCPKCGHQSPFTNSDEGCKKCGYWEEYVDPDDWYYEHREKELQKRKDGNGLY